MKKISLISIPLIVFWIYMLKYICVLILDVMPQHLKLINMLFWSGFILAIILIIIVIRSRFDTNKNNKEVRS